MVDDSVQYQPAADETLRERIATLEKLFVKQASINQNCITALDQQGKRITDIEADEEKVSSIIMPGRNH